jgi:DNA-binding transcriptional LysR family regulator
MWETVELREIRVFLALANELHFGRAADELGITQSRVSQSLRELELKLGETLVHRTSRRVELTAAGERFLAAVGPAHDQLASVLRRTGRADGEIEGSVSIGVFTAVSGGPRMVEVIDAFEQRHPSCRVDVKELPLGERLDPLRKGVVDLVTARLPVEQDDLVVGPILSSDPRVLGVATDHPLAERPEVTTEDIADYEVPDIAGMFSEELVEALIPRRTASGRPMKRRRLEHGEMSELITLVARGKLVHPTVPSFGEHFGHPGIRYVPISDMPMLDCALVWRRGGDGPRVRAFVEAAELVLERGGEA